MYRLVFGFFCFCAGVFMSGLFTTKVVATTQPTNTILLKSTDAVGHPHQIQGAWQQLAYTNGVWVMQASSDTILCNGFQ